MEKTTIADLRRHDQRLGLYCADCGRFRYVKPDYPDTAVLIDLSKDIRCFRCRSPDAVLKAVSRDAATGRWPAENG